MESKEQRDIRRKLSAWLSAQINDFSLKDDKKNQRIFGLVADGLGSKIREKSIQSLAQLNNRLDDIHQDIQSRYATLDLPLIKFYMKGGNAFKCTVNEKGPGATCLGGGDSDWDTQIVVDPWAPQPLLENIYGIIEDIIMDTFTQLSTEIANTINDYDKQQSRNPSLDFEKSITTAWEKHTQIDKGKHLSSYQLKLDKPQGIKKIYDHRQLGLWTHSNLKLNNYNSPTPWWMPGISFNESIQPFSLYRLGFSWHAKLADNADPSITPPIEKPLLMEIIDVTIPRKNTIEAVKVWQEIAQHHIKIKKTSISVNVKQVDKFTSSSVNLPLPDIFYHANEMAIMLCEIADGSSHHSDKMMKRFARFKEIYDNYPELQNSLCHRLSHLAGVADIKQMNDAIKQNTTVGDLLNKVTDETQKALLGLSAGATITTSYQLLVKMMNTIEDGHQKQQQYFCGKDIKPQTLINFAANRQAIKNLINRMISEKVLPAGLHAAFSDDLAIMDRLLENGYIDLSKVGFCGIEQAISLQLGDYDQLCLYSAKIISYLEQQKKGLAYQCLHKRYHIPRATGISREIVILVQKNAQTQAMIHLTTAEQSVSPFVKSPVGDGLLYTALTDIAQLRKVAAALLGDYNMTTCMSRQLEAIKSIIHLT